MLPMVRAVRYLCVALAGCMVEPERDPGEMHWTRTHDGAGHGPDRALDVVADAAGVIVAGWTSDAVGDADLFVRRYDRAGGIEWTVEVDAGAGRGVFASSIAFMPDGGFVVGGGIDAAADDEVVDWDPWLRRYGPEREEIWTWTAPGPTLGEDEIVGVAADADGRIAAVGYEMLADETTDMRIRVFDAEGTPLFSVAHDGPGAGIDAALSATFLPGGDIVVVGYETVDADAPPLTDIFIRRYDRSGDAVWTLTVDGPGSGLDRGTDVIVGPNDELFVSGFVCVPQQVMDAWIAAVDVAGNVLWERTHDGPDRLADWANEIAVDADGNVVAAGFEGWELHGFDVWATKHDSAGVELWTHRHRGPEGDDTAAAVAIDPDGFVYLAGSELAAVEDGPDGEPRFDFDLWIRKLEP